ncbi:hypothetical protein [Lacrimispora sp.]|uniref:hypothetical protein n=1 Tax=Lacrimispora sp. TaxID=2719234 RepID=UPI0028ADE8E8|nr:hypothetical protein [Lacrimispora sp.]
MYKFSAVFLSVILSFSLFNVAFAKNVPNFETHSITAEPEGIVLEVDSQEEFEALTQEIKESNAHANKMWEEAQARISDEPPLEARSITPRAYGTTNYKFTIKNNKISLILRYETTSTTGGIKRFSKVHDFLVTPHVNYTGVNNVHWQYEYLDSNRTVAVNTSFIVSIKEISGNYHNYDVTKYVEYYASGGVRGW